MITIYRDGIKYTETYQADIAIIIIKSLKSQGHRAEWTCNDPDDNEYIWENV